MLSGIHRIRLYGTLLLFCIVTSPAGAVWPEHLVKIVVPYAAGGAGDTLGRIVSNILDNSYKQAFVVENRPGAGGTVAALAVSKASPDGQVLLVAGTGSYVFGPAYYGVAYQPLRDFSHIALLGSSPIVLVVDAKLPVTDLQSFIAYASASRSGLSWGAPGMGTLPQLIGEMFVSSAKLSNAVGVNYKGDAPAIADLLGGHIQAAFMTLSSAKAHIKAGNFKAISIASKKRNQEFKDLPTFSELGYPQLTAAVWFCLSGPSGLPADLVSKLNHDIRKGFRQPEVRKMLLNEGFDLPDLSPGETTHFIEAEIRRWQPLIGVKVDPTAIDNSLINHPGIRDASAFGLDNSIVIQDVATAIMVDEKFDLATLQQELLKEFDPPRTPSIFIEVNKIPGNQMGRLERTLLIAL